jgi:prevent-host-death family protein
MGSRRITIEEFEKNFDYYLDAVDEAPIVITKDGRDYLVLLLASEYERLTKYDRPTSTKR